MTALAPVHDTCKKEIAAVGWRIELSAVMSHGSTNPAWKQMSANLYVFGRTDHSSVFPRACTRHLVIPSR